KPTEKPIEKPTEKLAEKPAEKRSVPPVTPTKIPDVIAAKPVPVAEPMKLAPPQKPAEPQIKPIEPVRRTQARDDDDRMGTPILPLRPPTRPTPEAASKAALAEPPAKPTPPPAKAVPSVAPAASRAVLQEALDSLPPPIDAPSAIPSAQPDKPVDAGLAAASALLNEVMEATRGEPAADAPKAPVVPIQVESPPKPVEIAKPVEPPKPVEIAKPVEPPKPVEIAKPVEPPVQAVVAQSTEKESGGGGKWLVVFILLLAIGGAAYWFVGRQFLEKRTSVRTVPVVVETVSRQFPTLAKVKKSEPAVMKIGSAGKVANVATEGKDVAAGESLVELEAFAQAQKSRADAEKAIEGLKKKLESGRLKGKAASDLQAKIDEKQASLAQLESQAKAARLVADKEVLVTKVMVKEGQTVEAETEIVAVSSKGLVAELVIGATETTSLTAGQTIALSSSDKKTAFSGSVRTVRKQDAQTTVVIDLPKDATVKDGDELMVEKAKLPQVASLPASALRDGSKVFVVKEGKLTAVSVTVLDRSEETIFATGIASGEQVVHPVTAELADGLAVEIVK
ncbi:MAG TPA: hypothetical protein PKE31_07045, partial [Pseudomonadota bacterium]|nr:hypothetical protein [Pseudomonadota bacterium]